MVEQATEHSTRATDDPWARLAEDGGRLQALFQQRRMKDVLAAVSEHRATMAALPDPPDADTAWHIRESILGIGVVAAHDLGEWSQALELSAAIRQSQSDRGADDVERAVTWFNEYGPLLRLGRAEEAREQLYRCRVAFGRAEDVTMMGNTLSALADVDSHLGNLDLSVEQETDALRLKYRGSDTEAIAVSHYNLANYLIRAGRDIPIAWAHRLAAAVIRYQTGSSRLSASVQSIGRLVGEHGAAKVPSFNDICLTVDGLPGVRFAELIGLLPHRAEDGQAAVDEIMRLTTGMRDAAIQESVAAWEPIISALVAARAPEPPAEVTPLLEDALAELAEQKPWQGLVLLLRRILATDNESAQPVEQLDPVSAAVAGRVRAALAGEVRVDPDAWRALIEQT